ncbi:CPSF7 factor, partial [Mionectes macconnelli]|nr:CPSF7 factor [Mionectes macconnelli]
QDPEFSNADQMDLYDDVLTASSQPQEKRSGGPEAPPEMRPEPPAKPNSKPPAILYTYSGLRNKRAAVYVGSFSWWTTDQQLIQTIRSIGVYDVVELKFAENRANGQSKGYAEVVVASENSVHKLLELLPGKILNGDKVEVRLATRQNLSQFEAQARKRECGVSTTRAGGSTAHTAPQTPPRSAARPSPASPWDGGKSRSFFSLLECQVFLPLAAAPLLLVLSPPCAPPRLGLPKSTCGSGSPGLWGSPPTPCGFWLLSLRPPCPPGHLVGSWRALGKTHGSRGYIWPAGSFPWAPPALRGGRKRRNRSSPGAGDPPAEIHRTLPLSQLQNSSSRELGPLPPAVSEGEFEEIMNRNRAISSSAISKAVSGASAGDYSNAIETLLTAIAVIKQSRVAGDERCRVLLSSLKDCLHGIEAKSYSSSSSSSSRKRHRSRERSPSRSRESSRRHRDLLHSDERHEDYFPERSREHERHRDRDRDRDR